MPETGSGAQDKLQSEILLGMLDLVERDPTVTQRSLARELRIALGLANAYLKRCIHKGLVKVSQVPPRRYAYYLTPQGFAEKSRLTASYLAYSFSFFREARAQLSEIFQTAVDRGQRRLVLVGEGDLAEIASLSAGKYAVEICATVAATQDPSQLRASIQAAGNVDAVVLTAMANPHAVYEAARAFLPAERVHAPALLRIRSNTKPEERI
jgi:DNA-binding MarR family transcriptional regulator